MKKRFFIIYLIGLHLFAVVALLKTDFIPKTLEKLGYELPKEELTKHFYRMLAFHKRQDANIPEGSVIFIGDSLTQGLAVSAVHPRGINFGIGQDTTLGVLHRIPHYTSISKASLVVIAIGHNDLKVRPADAIIENYQQIVDLIPAHIPVLISAILPVDESLSGLPGFNAKVAQLNSRLKDLSNKQKRLFFSPIADTFVIKNGNLANEFHIGDGVHPNGAGNSLWISSLRASIEDITQ